jgi:hypothetical protein
MFILLTFRHELLANWAILSGTAGTSAQVKGGFGETTDQKAGGSSPPGRTTCGNGRPA